MLPATTIMVYVNKLKDVGMRKVMTFQILHRKTPKQIAKILKIQESTVETIGKKGALKVRELIYNDLKKRGVIVGKNNTVQVPGVRKETVQLGGRIAPPFRSFS